MCAFPGDDPESLSVGFYSIVIRKAAVIRRFSSGVAALDARFGIIRQNDALLLLCYMSTDDAEHVLDELERAGLRPEEDLAVGDMMQGPLLSCTGIAFRNVGDTFPPPRSAERTPARE